MPDLSVGFRFVGRLCVASAVALVAAHPAGAQTTPAPDLAELLPNLILRGITLPRPTTPNISHEAHFSPIESNELNNPAVGIVQGFNKLMLAQLSTFPLGSSAGGFTYTFDDSLGTFRRSSGSFGPSFAERAITIGRRKLNAGVTYQHTSYSSFEGQDLDDGSIRFYLRHQECCTSGSAGGAGGGGGTGGGVREQPDGSRLTPAFEGDVIEAALSLDASTDTVAFFGNYGLTNRWDVGVVVPIVRVDMAASVQATIMRLATAAIPAIHTFESGNPQATQRVYRQSGTATGIGDVLLRTKYQVAQLGGGGIAGAVDVRLPTGDEQNLLGAGTQVKLLFIASGVTGRIAPHVNLGYTAVSGEVGSSGLLAMLGGDANLPDEWNYAAGIEYLAGPRLTLNGDIVGRTLRHAGRLELTAKEFRFQALNVVDAVTFDEFESVQGNLNLTLGTVGVKVNPVGNLLISGHVLFPLTDAGLRSRLTTVIGFDYAF